MLPHLPEAYKEHELNMSRDKNFRECYETTLKPDLEIIDSERKKVNRRSLTIISATVAAVILEIVLILSGAGMLKAALPMITGFAGLFTTGSDIFFLSVDSYTGEDQVEARYILTPSLMERILAYKCKWKSRISLSFCDSKDYIAISMNKNLFEARIFKPVADYSFMEENLRFLILLTEIVEDLNLNTRIWTKE
jgi:hypothetical protein